MINESARILREQKKSGVKLDFKYIIVDEYQDISKVFIGQGGGVLASEGENDNKIVVSQAVINQLDEDKSYKFSIVPSGNTDTSYMYYSIGSVSNVRNGSPTYYVVRYHNALELICMKNDLVLERLQYYIEEFHSASEDNGFMSMERIT